MPIARSGARAAGRFIVARAPSARGAIGVKTGRGWARRRGPGGYHGTPGAPLPFLAVASQKRHIAVYHMGIYADPGLLDWFVREYEALGTGRKLDMGKSCIRFRKPEHVSLDLIGRLVAKVTSGEWIAAYEGGRGQGRRG